MVLNFHNTISIERITRIRGFCTIAESKTQTIGGADVRAKKTLHLMTGSLLSGSGLGGNAIGRDDNLVAAHVGVVGREQHANVRSKPRDNQFLGAKALQENFQRGAEETRVARFQNEVVIFPWPERLRHRRTGGTSRGATFDLRLKVGTPPTKIIVHINRGNVMPLEALLESLDPLGGRDRVAKQLCPLGKRKIVDDVDEQKHDRRVLTHGSLWSRTLFVHQKIVVRGFEYAPPPAKRLPPRRSGHASRREGSANLRIPLSDRWVDTTV
jgi:hypothetical protein